MEQVPISDYFTMGDTTCTFEFNNASRIFYSGQTIAGRVHLYLPNDKKARGN